MSKENQEIVKMCVERLTKEDQDRLMAMKQKSGSLQQFNRLAAAFYTEKLWPKKSILNICFLESADNIPRTPTNSLKFKRNSQGNALKLDPMQEKVKDMPVEEAIKLIVNEILAPIVNLQFNFVTDPKKANIRISFNKNAGAYSLVGTDCLKQKDPSKATMNLGWFDVPTTIHEFGHALGMVHEHQNPQGNPIQWDEQKVIEWAKETQGWDKKITENNILGKYDDDQINGSSFDPLSIMLYFFPGELTTNNIGTQQNLRLSGLDVQFLQEMYPGSVESPEEFYKKYYKEDIQDSIQESQDSPINKSNNNNFFNILKIIGILLVLYFLYTFLYTNKKTKKKR